MTFHPSIGISAAKKLCCNADSKDDKSSYGGGRQNDFVHLSRPLSRRSRKQKSVLSEDETRSRCLKYRYFVINLSDLIVKIHSFLPLISKVLLKILSQDRKTKPPWRNDNRTFNYRPSKRIRQLRDKTVILSPLWPLTAMFRRSFTQLSYIRLPGLYLEVPTAAGSYRGERAVDGPKRSPALKILLSLYYEYHEWRAISAVVGETASNLCSICPPRAGHVRNMPGPGSTPTRLELFRNFLPKYAVTVYRCVCSQSGSCYGYNREFPEYNRRK